MIQNRSWKIDENIFHQKCPKQHFLATGSAAGDAGDDISSKTHENFVIFLTSLPLCRDGNSQTRPGDVQRNTMLIRSEMIVNDV